MPIDLTNQEIKDTYNQLLHISGWDGVAEKIIYLGDGTPTPLSISPAGLFFNGVAIGSEGITIKEIDGAPSFTATTIEFPNGSLTNQGGGVGRLALSIASITGLQAALDAKASLTDATEIAFVTPKLSVTGDVYASVFHGSGASLSNIPESAVVNLTSDLAAKAGTGFTSASTSGVNIVGTVGTNGVSLGVPQFITTGMASNFGSNFIQANAIFVGTNVTGTIGSNGITVSVALDTNNIVMSAGTNSTNAGTVNFSNSNGISFGLNTNGVMTAAHNAITTAMQSNANTISNVNVSAGTTSQNLSNFVFSNSNGLSFGLNGSTITGAHNGIMTARASNDAIGLNTAKTNVTWTVNSGGLSLDASGYAATGFTSTTAAGATVVGTQDTSGLKLGIPAFITTAMQSNAATISNVNLSAGTTSQNLSAMVFSNGNGVSFGLNGSTITASVAAAGGVQTAISGIGNSETTYTSGTVGWSALGALTVRSTTGQQFQISVGPYITTAMQSNAAIISNVNVSAGTTSNNLSNFVFSNSNGLSFGLSGSTITASHNAITTARASTDGIGLNTAKTNATWTVNSNGLSLDASGYAGTGFTSATTAGVAIVGTNNTAGLSLNIPNFLTTAMQSNAATISNINMSAGTTSQNLSNFVFSNSNGVSFGLSGSTVTASHNALTTARASNDAIGLNTAKTNVTWTVNSGGISIDAGAYLTTAMQSNAATISNVNMSAGTTSQNLSNFVFSNSNGVSFGLNGSTVTASVATNYLTTARASTDGIGLNTAGTNITWTANSAGLSINAGGYAGTGFTSTTIGGAVVAATHDTNGLKLAVPSYLTTAMQSNAVTISNINASAGTTSQNLSNFVFSNSNGVSFGLNGSTFTASVQTNYLTTARASNDAIGLNTAQTNVTWTVNSSGLSINAAGYAGTGFTSTTTGGTAIVGTHNTAGLSIGVPLFLTTAMQSNAATISNINLSAGTTSNNLSAFVFSNSNGVSFGLNGSTVTGSHNGLTTARASNDAIGLNTAKTNVTWTVNSSGISLDAGAYLTTAMQSNAATISNINLSAGTTSNNLSAMVFSNGNGVSFGLNGSTVTASVAAAGGAQTGISGIGNSETTYTSGTVGWSALGALTIRSTTGQQFQVSVGPYITTAMASNRGSDFIAATAGFNGTNISGTLASNGISLSVDGPGAFGGFGLSAGASADVLKSVTFQNSNGISFGLNGAGVVTATVQTNYLTTAMLSNAVTISNINLSAGTTSQNLSAFVFSNSNSISFGLSGSTITASMAAQTNQSGNIYAVGNTFGTSSGTRDARTLSIAGTNGAQVAASNSGFVIGLVPDSQFEPFPIITGTAFSSHAPASWWFNRIYIPDAPVYVSNINMIRSMNVGVPTMTSAGSSGTLGYSWSHGITVFQRVNQSNSSSQLTTVGTASVGFSGSYSYTGSLGIGSTQNFGYSWGTNTTGGLSTFSTSSASNGWSSYGTGGKLIAVPWVTTLQPGEYFFAHKHSSTTASAGQQNTTLFSISNLHIAPPVITYGRLGTTAAFINGPLAPFGCGGIASAITTNATMPYTVITAATQNNWYMMMSNI